MTRAETDALEARLAAMTEKQVRALYESSEPESEEGDIIAGEMERRNIDD